MSEQEFYRSNEIAYCQRNGHFASYLIFHNAFPCDFRKRMTSRLQIRDSREFCNPLIINKQDFKEKLLCLKVVKKSHKKAYLLLWKSYAFMP